MKALEKASINDRPTNKPSKARQFWNGVRRGSILLVSGLMVLPTLAKADQIKTNPLAWNPASVHNNTPCGSLLGKQTWLPSIAELSDGKVTYAGSGVLAIREVDKNFLEVSLWGELTNGSKIENVKAGFSRNAGPASFGVRASVANGEKVETGIEAGVGVSGIRGPIGLILVGSAGPENKAVANISILPAKATISVKFTKDQKPGFGADWTFAGKNMVRGGVGEGFKSIGAEFYVGEVCVDADIVIKPDGVKGLSLVLGF